MTHTQYELVSKAIYDVHEMDPVIELYDGKEFPSESLYSQRMLQMLNSFDFNCGELIKIAVQCQHLRRWDIARQVYSADKKGYHQWRRAVMLHQLSQMNNILDCQHVDASEINKIHDMLLNQGNKLYAEAQIIQDVACLVFLKWYFEPFAQKHEKEKIVDILKKTMRKMSEKALETSGKLGLSDNTRQYISLASV